MYSGSYGVVVVVVVVDAVEWVVGRWAVGCAVDWVRVFFDFVFTTAELAAVNARVCLERGDTLTSLLADITPG